MRRSVILLFHGHYQTFIEVKIRQDQDTAIEELIE